MKYKIALKIATELHEGQIRKVSGLPYIVHPIAVADKFDDEDLKVCAVLHDVIEDTSMTIRTLMQFYDLSNKQAKILNSLTKKKSIAYNEYIMDFEYDFNARMIKIEDIKHNLSDLENGHQRDKYLLALHVLEIMDF